MSTIFPTPPPHLSEKILEIQRVQLQILDLMSHHNKLVMETFEAGKDTFSNGQKNTLEWVFQANHSVTPFDIADRSRLMHYRFGIPKVEVDVDQKFPRIRF